MLSVCIVEIHVTVNNIKMQSVVQKGFNGEFMSPETIECRLLRSLRNVHAFFDDWLTVHRSITLVDRAS